MNILNIGKRLQGIMEDYVSNSVEKLYLILVRIEDWPGFEVRGTSCKISAETRYLINGIHFSVVI